MLDIDLKLTDICLLISSDLASTNMSALPSASAAAAAAASLVTHTPIPAAKLAQAARLIHEADALLICTGAGMSVASGLGTFRGAAAGVWPPLLKHDPSKPIPFQAMSCPDWFHKPMTLTQPLKGINFGLAFWQFRYQTYTAAPPHEGYKIILDWIESKPIPEGVKNVAMNKHLAGFSFTSNIDSHWERAGLAPDQLLECHGSIAYTQCAGVDEPVNLDAGEVEPSAKALIRKPHACTHAIWPANPDDWKMEVDAASDGVKPPFPRCHFCNSLSRPNVLMFNDYEWLSGRCDEQEERFMKWMGHLTSKTCTQKMCIIEIGAGTAIPTVRHRSESTVRLLGQRASFIRLNPEEAHIPTEIGGGGRVDLENKASGGRLLSFTQQSIDVLRHVDEEVKKLRASTVSGAGEKQ